MIQHPSKIEFSVALMKERARFQLSRREVADQCGVSEREVKRWERGDAIPSRQQFKRLVGMMPRMAPHFPSWGGLGGLAVTGAVDEDRMHNQEVVAELERRGELPVKPEPQDFHLGLKRVREENEVTQEELGELIGVVGQSVSQWESGDVLPVKENLLKLFEVLPELKAGMETGAIRRPKWAQDIAKPTGGRGFPRASTVDTMLDMVLANSDEVAALPRPERFRHEAPGIPGPHEHMFTKTQELPGSLPGGGIPTRIVCAICGEPRPEPEGLARPRRCGKCGGECEHQQNPDRPFDPLAGVYICKRCRAMLTFSQTNDAEDAHMDSSQLALSFVQARIKLRKAREAEQAAQETLVNASTARRDAEAEAKLAEELLELAISEAK